MQRIVVESLEKQHGSGDTAAATADAAAAAAAAVYEEMLQDCRRKAGDATLDRLRKVCQKLGRPEAADAEGEEGTGEEETVMLSYHAALLGRAEGAANIYGGWVLGYPLCICCGGKRGATRLRNKISVWLLAEISPSLLLL